MIKKILTGLMAMSLMASNVNALELKGKIDVEQNKIWNIKFNEKLEDFNKDEVKVFDSKGSEVKTNSTIKNGNIIVESDSQYNNGETYKLFIGENVNPNEKLKESATMKFKIKDKIILKDIFESPEIKSYTNFRGNEGYDIKENEISFDGVKPSKTHEINDLSIRVINNLVDKNYTYVWYRKESEELTSTLAINYAVSERGARNNSNFFSYYFFDNDLLNLKESFGSKDGKLEDIHKYGEQIPSLSERAFLKLAINFLYWDTEEAYEEPYRSKLENSIKALFPEEGEKIYQYIIDEYIKDFNSERPEDNDDNPFNNYLFAFKKIGNIRIDYIRNDSVLKFYFTNEEK